MESFLDNLATSFLQKNSVKQKYINTVLMHDSCTLFSLFAERSKKKQNHIISSHCR